jgi:hypothetical protein
MPSDPHWNMYVSGDIMRRGSPGLIPVRALRWGRKMPQLHLRGRGRGESILWGWGWKPAPDGKFPVAIFSQHVCRREAGAPVKLRCHRFMKLLAAFRREYFLYKYSRLTPLCSL